MILCASATFLTAPLQGVAQGIGSTLVNKAAGLVQTQRPKIIGVGESAHGSATLQELGFELAKRLIIARVVSDIVLEGSDGALSALSRAVEQNQGNVTAALLSQRYPIWKTAEAREFFEWLRLMNAERPRRSRVRVHGNDIQNPNAAHSHIVSVLRELVPALARQTEALLSRIDPFADLYFDQVENDVALALLHELNGVLAQVARARPARDALSSDAWATAHRQLRAYRAHLIAYSAARPVGLTEEGERSKAMAELTADIARQSIGSVIVFMHAGHTAREVGSAGGRLAKEWGRHYLPIGTFFGKGEVLSRLSADTTATIPCDLPPDTSTLEGLFESHHRDTVVILRGTPKWVLDQPLHERAFGASDSSCGFTTSLSAPRKRFDLLLFAWRGKASRSIQ